jgi:LCP family protein required for cell wall assembly
VADTSDTPRYRVYRGGDGKPGDADPALDRIRALGAPAAAAPAVEAPVADAPVVEPPAAGTPAAPPPRSSPIVLPEPGAPPSLPPGGLPPAEPAAPRPYRRPSWRRIALLTALVLLAALVAWVGFGYWQFRAAIGRANERVTPATQAALTPTSSSILRDPRTILVLGSDRRDDDVLGRADSLLLLRSDPDRGQLTMLSIPRDLRAEIPGHGPDRINAAYAIGGPPLAIRTVQGLTGIPVNDVVQVDFDGFKSLVDALGGVTVSNPEKIISEEFEGYEWRFGRGDLHLDGRHALAYARVRKNQLNAGDTDVTRGLRQQRVLDGIASGLASPSTLLRLPSVGDAIGDPLTTSLTANDLLALGWRWKRSDRVLRCRLGGQPAGDGTLIGDEANRQVVAMALGRSAPQPPPPAQPLAPGCTVS